MLNKYLQLPCIVLATLLGGPLSLHAQYDYAEIDRDGSAFIITFGINDRGDVALTGSPPSYVFKAADGTRTEINVPDGYESISAIGISDSGVLVGSLDLSGSYERQAFIKNADGTLKIFSHPDAVNDTQARAVQNKGLVTGFYSDSQAFRGFIYDPKNESFIDVAPDSSYYVIAQGINSRGEVVGNARFLENDPCGTQLFSEYGWVRAKDGTLKYFSVNGMQTAARGINDAGEVAGFTTDPATGIVKSFVIDVPDTNCQSVTVDSTDLVEFPGAIRTFVQAINNKGELVGNYSLQGEQDSRAFIARPLTGAD